MDHAYKSFKYVFKFALSSITGTTLFLIVFAPALFLSLLIQHTYSDHPQIIIIYYLGIFVKYVMFSLDVGLLIVFLLKEFWVAAKAIVYEE